MLAIFVDMNLYKGISKYPWKNIVQLIWTVVTYSLKNVEFSKKMLGIELNMILIVLLEFEYIKTFPEPYSILSK